MDMKLITADRVIECINIDDPELDGDMPDEMSEEIKGDRLKVQAVMRACVISSKESIRKRILNVVRLQK